VTVAWGAGATLAREGRACTQQTPAASGVTAQVRTWARGSRRRDNGDVPFRMKLASSIGISEFITDSVKPDGVAIVDCGGIRNFNLHLIHGFEGFLVIESLASLDVIAVYTAGEKHVESIDVESVRERVLR
jgi:hypothetical protein